MGKAFSRIELAGISMPGMVIGSNWMLGYSHTSPAADGMIRGRNGDAKTVAGILSAFLDAGVDAVMAPFEAGSPLLRGIRLAQERAGRRMILGTPVLNVDDTPAARREAAREIAQSRENGAAFCLIHHSSAEQLVNKNKKMLGRLPDYRRASMDELPQAWNTLKSDMSIVGPRPMMPEEIIEKAAPVEGGWYTALLRPGPYSVRERNRYTPHGVSERSLCGHGGYQAGLPSF